MLYGTVRTEQPQSPVDASSVARIKGNVLWKSCAQNWTSPRVAERVGPVAGLTVTGGPKLNLR